MLFEDRLQRIEITFGMQNAAAPITGSTIIAPWYRTFGINHVFEFLHPPGDKFGLSLAIIGILKIMR